SRWAISPAAAVEKVSTRTWPRPARPLSTISAYRSTSACVLPVPGPASSRTGPWSKTAAVSPAEAAAAPGAPAVDAVGAVEAVIPNNCFAADPCEATVSPVKVGGGRLQVGDRGDDLAADGLQRRQPGDPGDGGDAG